MVEFFKELGWFVFWLIPTGIIILAYAITHLEKRGQEYATASATFLAIIAIIIYWIYFQFTGQLHPFQ